VSRYPTLDRHLRVTIGTPAEDDAFLTALAEELADEHGGRIPGREPGGGAQMSAAGAHEAASEEEDRQ
jgi:hypothetical protein